jgi:hypothetical protein
MMPLHSDYPDIGTLIGQEDPYGTDSILPDLFDPASFAQDSTAGPLTDLITRSGWLADHNAAEPLQKPTKDMTPGEVDACLQWPFIFPNGERKSLQICKAVLVPYQYSYTDKDGKQVTLKVKLAIGYYGSGD